MRRFKALLGAVAVLVAACGDTAATPEATPSTAPTTTTAAPTTTTAAPTTTTAAPTTTTTAVAGFPVTIPADNGDVTIEARPERIVSLSSTHTEVLYAIGAGARIVATDLTSNHPAAANETPKLDSFNFNVEEVAGFDPDLVILAFDFQGESEQLAALGIAHLVLGPPSDVGGMLDQIVAVGRATGDEDEAVDLASDLADRMDAIVARAGGVAGVSFFHEVDETLYSTTSASFLGDVYARLGLVNIADEADPGNPFPQLSPEFIIAADPEIVFLGDAGFGVTPASVADRPGWDVLSAVVAGNVYPLDADIAGRWGPRTVDLMGQILEFAEEAVS